MPETESNLEELRTRLNERGVKLWEAPYYVEGPGSVDSAMEQLAKELSSQMEMSATSCKDALKQLQEHALRKLNARREFNETGLATFHVRCVDSKGGTAHTLEVKMSLDEPGSTLQRKIADLLNLSEADHVKCISAGKMVTALTTLEAQGLKNNQQLLVIVGQADARGEELYERIRQILQDVELVVDSNHHLIDLEDQDGNAMFLPPHENHALLLGMALYEKGRAAMRREGYDEALLLFLEADEKFNSCDYKFLECVDNYALLNLDIVWCYLCLKNITQLPDAQRRLDVCEHILLRSYGPNFSRLFALKGPNCPERAVIARLHLLQGVIHFHSNRRQEARERLQSAAAAIQVLKVDADQLNLLTEMGFDVATARLALRATNGNIEEAVQFIQQRRQRVQQARLKSISERELSRRLDQQRAGRDDADWVHPRSVCRLMDLGYDPSLAAEALRRTKNDLNASLDLLQFHSDELRRNLPAAVPADEQKLETLRQLGFRTHAARAALEMTRNNMDDSIDFLLKSFANERDLNVVIENMSLVVAAAVVASPNNNGVTAASTSSASSADRPSVSTPSKLALVQSVLSRAKKEIETYSAYKRFNKDIADYDQEYLDLPLEKEEAILNEYRQLLEH